MLKKVIGIILVTLLFTTAGFAKEINNVKMPDTISAGGKNLVLNGAGLRTKFFIKAYVSGLYLAQKSSDATAIINADEVMAVRLTITSGLIDSKKMTNAINEGFENATNGNVAPIKGKIDQFMAVFKEPIKVNDTYEFINIPGKGVDITKNGVSKGTITGLDFKKALFGIWLCDKPAQESLKKEMLGN